MDRSSAMPDPRVADPHGTHLFWDGRTGHARHNGAFVALVEPPELTTIAHLVRIDYMPSLRHAQVRESGRDARKMRPPEVDEVRLLLDKLAAGAHGVFRRAAPEVDPFDALEPCIAKWRAMSEVIVHLHERHELLRCLNECGVPYAKALAVLDDLRATGEIAIAQAIADAAKTRKGKS
jgi:hypothetical protein